MRTRYRWDDDTDVWVAWFKYPSGELGFTQAETIQDTRRAVVSCLDMLRKWYRSRRARRRH